MQEDRDLTSLNVSHRRIKENVLKKNNYWSYLDLSVYSFIVNLKGIISYFISKSKRFICRKK